MIAIYNLEPHPGEAGLIAFNFPLLHSRSSSGINSRTESDYGLDVETEYITHLLPFALHRRASLGRSGRSSDTDARRACRRDRESLPRRPGTPPTPSNATEKPFLSNPTTCEQEGLTRTSTVNSYDMGVDSRRHRSRRPPAAIS